MKRSVYTGLHYAMMPIVLGRLKWLSRKHPGYGKNIGERFGHAEKREDRPLWIHAVSVGETIASEPLVRRLQSEHPDWPILITNTTPTGAEQTQRLFGDSVSAQYAPYDTPSAINRFLNAVSPRALVVMETELWPNWIAALSERDVPVVVANARLSEKSLAGYLRLGTMTQDMMKSITRIAAQYEADANRFIEAGALPANVVVSGNIKADIQITEQDRQIASEARSKILASRFPVLIAASTHPGEDEIVLDSFLKIRMKFPNALLFLVPRHPARSSDIEAQAKARNLAQTRRSFKAEVKPETAVVLCDQMGELRGLFGVADIAIMGGTLVDHGGHNPLEPAAWSLPIIAGPSQRNFDSLFGEMESAGGLIRTEATSESLADNLLELICDEDARKGAGNNACKYLNDQQGAVERLKEILDCALTS